MWIVVTKNYNDGQGVLGLRGLAENEALAGEGPG
jgi:hypothetical protein